ncbi:MAG: permease-like cell division protein FtsX [Gammaproteobacteria bacterium]|nr:permease-like cell division protein FtsX [Gammaproteobacteria bacterium]MBU1656298.1 permease-like cell division protein FtsX [Gammaproteobacteria bacterium]MBU1959863.1 permease-like cell division protein FtsX [Gammaproteobacteria bacterium]
MSRFEHLIPPPVLLAHHLQTALASLGRLSRNPIGSLMTVAVIGIALALPAGLHLILSNLQSLGDNWDGSSNLSLFLKKEAPESGGRRLMERIGGMGEVGKVKFVTAEEALAEFRRFSGFADVLDLLQDNPLPAVILVQPKEQSSDPATVEKLVELLKKESLVDHIQLDLQWVKRFAAITQIAQRGVLVLAGLLSMAVLLVIGNSIRLEIQSRHEEIEITKLIGASNAFIRRPFLYSGFWFGLLGGFFALLLVLLSAFLLDEPTSELALLYSSDFSVTALDSTSVLGFLIGSPVLGLLGAAIAVGRHLKRIEPS